MSDPTRQGDDGEPHATDRPRCGRKTRSGTPCQAWPVAGTDVCRMHGGSAPQVRAAAERRLERAAAERAAGTYGLPVEVDPLAALLGELYRTAGHVAWLGALVAELEHVEGGESGLKQYRKGEGGALWERPSVWVELYQHERAHLAKVARDCLAAGVEERRVKMEEATAELIARAFRGFAVELGHDPADPAVRTAFRRHLAVVRGEAA